MSMKSNTIPDGRQPCAVVRRKSVTFRPIASFAGDAKQIIQAFAATEDNLNKGAATVTPLSVAVREPDEWEARGIRRKFLIVDVPESQGSPIPSYPPNQEVSAFDTSAIPDPGAFLGEPMLAGSLGDVFSWLTDKAGLALDDAKKFYDGAPEWLRTAMQAAALGVGAGATLKLIKAMAPTATKAIQTVSLSNAIRSLAKDSEEPTIVETDKSGEKVMYSRSSVIDSGDAPKTFMKVPADFVAQGIESAKLYLARLKTDDAVLSYLSGDPNSNYESRQEEEAYKILYGYTPEMFIDVKSGHFIPATFGYCQGDPILAGKGGKWLKKISGVVNKVASVAANSGIPWVSTVGKVAEKASGLVNKVATKMADNYEAKQSAAEEGQDEVVTVSPTSADATIARAHSAIHHTDDVPAVEARLAAQESVEAPPIITPSLNSVPALAREGKAEGMIYFQGDAHNWYSQWLIARARPGKGPSQTTVKQVMQQLMPDYYLAIAKQPSVFNKACNLLEPIARSYNTYGDEGGFYLGVPGMVMFSFLNYLFALASDHEVDKQVAGMRYTASPSLSGAIAISSALAHQDEADKSPWALALADALRGPMRNILLYPAPCAYAVCQGGSDNVKRFTSMMLGLRDAMAMIPTNIRQKEARLISEALPGETPSDLGIGFYDALDRKIIRPDDFEGTFNDLIPATIKIAKCYMTCAWLYPILVKERVMPTLVAWLERVATSIEPFLAKCEHVTDRLSWEMGAEAALINALNGYLFELPYAPSLGGDPALAGQGAVAKRIQKTTSESRGDGDDTSNEDGHIISVEETLPGALDENRPDSVANENQPGVDSTNDNSTRSPIDIDTSNQMSEAELASWLEDNPDLASKVAKTLSEAKQDEDSASLTTKLLQVGVPVTVAAAIVMIFFPKTGKALKNMASALWQDTTENFNKLYDKLLARYHNYSKSIGF